MDTQAKLVLAREAYAEIGQAFLNAAAHMTPKKVEEIEDGIAKAFWDAEWKRLLGLLLPQEARNGKNTQTG